jgi:hypothetical protein
MLSNPTRRKNNLNLDKFPIRFSHGENIPYIIITQSLAYLI